MTRYPELFEALARPFATHEEKTRQGPGGRPLTYATARTFMNRLDDVVGPENWWDDYAPTGRHGSLVGKLWLRLPDGTILKKEDAGGEAGMKDEGDDDKSAYSDAFKRVAVKFGVGRYLYRDGVARLSPALGSAPGTQDPPAVGSSPVPPRSMPRKPLRSLMHPKSGGQLYAWAKAGSDEWGLDLVEMLQKWGQSRSLPQDFRTWDIGDAIDGYLAMAQELDRRGLLDIPPEAREQMARSIEYKDETKGPLSIDRRDSLADKKVRIKEAGKRLYRHAFGKDPSGQKAVMEYIQVRCRDHKIVCPDSIRNHGISQDLDAILGALLEDEREARMFKESS